MLQQPQLPTKLNREVAEVVGSGGSTTLFGGIGWDPYSGQEEHSVEEIIEEPKDEMENNEDDVQNLTSVDGKKPSAKKRKKVERGCMILIHIRFIPPAQSYIVLIFFFSIPQIGLVHNLHRLDGRFGVRVC